MSYVTVKPVPGRLVRDPLTMQPIPEEGLRVQRTVFWTRALRDGDVQAVEALDGRDLPQVRTPEQE